jgi:hypothetical protein
VRQANRTRLADNAVATWERADNVIPMYAEESNSSVPARVQQNPIKTEAAN